jgi:hypothetical protein
MANHNFTRYLKEVVDDYDQNYPTLRWGQTYLNVLHKYQPNMVFKIFNENKVDPFYNDTLIPKFLDYVRAHWGVYDQDSC